MGEAHEGEEEREMGEATEAEGWCEGKRELAGIVEAAEGDWWRGGKGECAGIVEALENPGCLLGSPPL